MIGHRSIIAARQARKAPRCVFVTVGPIPPVHLAHDRFESEMAEGYPPQVVTGDDDPRLVDLRFLHGLTVVLDESADHGLQFLEWFDAICDVKPKAVHACNFDLETFSWPVR